MTKQRSGGIAFEYHPTKLERWYTFFGIVDDIVRLAVRILTIGAIYHGTKLLVAWAQLAQH